MENEDAIKAKLYEDFYIDNTKLFKHDRQEYFRLQRIYCERELLKYKYYGKTNE